MGDRRINLFRITAVIVLALAFVYVQAAFQWPRRLLGAQIDLLPALMVVTALRLGLGSIIAVAFIGGLSMDSLSLNPMGVSPLPLCLAGVVIHWKQEQILQEEVVAQMLLGAGASLAVPIGTLIMTLSAGATPLVGLGFVWDLIVMTVAGALVTPWIFKLLNLLENTLTYKPDSQPSFRPDREIRRGRH
jgi:rod shape-determining protein MreD